MVQPPGLHMRSQSRRPTMVLYSTFECTMKGIWSMSTYGEPWSPTVQKFLKSLSIGQKSVTDWQQLSEEGREEIWGAQVSTKFTLNFFKNWPFTASFFFIFVFSMQLTVNNVQDKFCRFEPKTSGVGSDLSTNWATTTAQCAINLILKPVLVLGTH